MSYTRYMAHCCETFKHSTLPTDALITPIVQACELWSRVNDHFSYDSIEYTEVHGELMLSMSTANFRKELQRVKDAATYYQLAEQNSMSRSRLAHFTLGFSSTLICLVDNRKDSIVHRTNKH